MISGNSLGCKTNPKPFQNHFMDHIRLLQNRSVFDLIPINKNKKKYRKFQILNVKLIKTDKFYFK